MKVNVNLFLFNHFGVNYPDNHHILLLHLVHLHVHNRFPDLDLLYLVNNPYAVLTERRVPIK